MSSLFEAALQSNDGDRQDVRSETSATVRRRPRSSSRPRGPPSVSTPGVQSDMPGFEDDELVGARALRRGLQGADVPPVLDDIAEKVGAVFGDFLENYTEAPKKPDDGVDASSPAPTSTPKPERYYVDQIRGLARYGLSTLYVDWQHVMAYGKGVMADAIAENFYRHQPYLIRALHGLIAKYAPRYFRQHRQPGTSTAASNASTFGTEPSDEDDIAKRTVNQQTDKIFALAFYNLPLVSRVRSLRTEQIGRLASISGTVTRTSEVRPELLLATFICEACNTVVPNVEQVFRYSEPTQCPNSICGNRQGWRLDIRQSTFVDWQKVRIQENSSEIPTGSMPRTMDVIMRGEIVDRAKAGEKCVFTGTLIVVPDVSQFRVPGVRPQSVRDTANAPRGADAGGSGVTGLKALGVRDLTYRMVFLANMVTPDQSTAGQSSAQQLKGLSTNILASLNQTTPNEDVDPDVAQQEYLATLTPAEIDDVRVMVHTPNIFMRLVDSLAPMVYGHSVIKKGLLLQLMGGVSKTTQEGMALRGDINICIVGDPSTSKSQFLKYICSFLPRAVYTSGKASSAAGLTAAVVKDEETGEFTIEAGALMLADNGICAIDEFDKMDIADQVAIHEAMEQQTISIAKAGIQATLNARTSILAAANPVGGRYNRKTTLRANINMSAPIMSRFDLFFVVLDECNESVDRHLARHIVGIHQMRDEAVEPEFSTEQLQRYIRFARTFKPHFKEDAKARLVQRYKELRADDAQGGIGRNSYRITVRQLESMIRLSEAIAKANCVDEITVDFVDEAFGLLRQSIVLVEKDDIEMEEEEEQEEQVAEQGAGEEMEDEEEEEAEQAQPEAAASSSNKRTQIKYDKYMSILNLMIRRVNDDQTTADDGVEEDDLVVWYLEQVEGELESQEDLEHERLLARKVLKKMVKDNVLMQIRGEGLVEDGRAGEGSSGNKERVVYVMHPNCAVEEM